MQGLYRQGFTFKSLESIASFSFIELKSNLQFDELSFRYALVYFCHTSSVINGGSIIIKSKSFYYELIVERSLKSKKTKFLFCFANFLSYF